jgi:hypothetical protein
VEERARPLEVVGSEPAETGTGPETGGGERSRGGVLVWILAGILVLVVAAFLTQVARNSELGARVTELEVELATAKGALSAHRAQLDRIRTSVAELESLVNQDPLAPADEEL